MQKELKTLHQIYTNVDKDISSFLEAQPDISVKCDISCGLCCNVFHTIFPVEKTNIQYRLRKDRIRRRIIKNNMNKLKARLSNLPNFRPMFTFRDDDLERCPARDKGICKIYSYRPLICRVQGPPFSMMPGGDILLCPKTEIESKNHQYLELTLQVEMLKSLAGEKTYGLWEAFE